MAHRRHQAPSHIIFRLSILGVLFVSLVSCKGIAEPNEYDGTGFPKKIGSDTIHALLKYDYKDIIKSDGSMDVDASVKAFLADDKGYVDVLAISANSQKLTNSASGSAHTGFYYLDDPFVSAEKSPSVVWAVQGYLGSDFTTTFQLAPRFLFLVNNFVDTISKANGKLMPYSNGVSGTDSIIVYLYDAESVENGEYLLKTAPDNGVLRIDSAELAGIAVNRQYYVKYGRIRDSVVSYQGRKILLTSTYFVDGFVFLVP